MIISVRDGKTCLSIFLIERVMYYFRLENGRERNDKWLSGKTILFRFWWDKKKISYPFNLFLRIHWSFLSKENKDLEMKLKKSMAGLNHSNKNSGSKHIDF